MDEDTHQITRTPLEDLDYKIKELQQELDIQRRVRQKMGETADNESVLIKEETLRVLRDEKAQMLWDIDRAEYRIYYWVFATATIIFFIAHPLAGAIMLVPTIFMRRVAYRKRKK